jgi:structural maintenance of chromosome 3 (chondroitin sulfate proteoglycan 6)
MNQQKLLGEVNYLPLNVLKDNNQNDESNGFVPDVNDAISLLKKIKYESKVERAVKHVFDKILLCRNGEIATQLAKKARMDCVSLDGDLASMKGALTGGYIDTRQSKLQYHKQRVEMIKTIAQKESENEALRKQIASIDSELNAVLNDLQKHETKSKRTKDLYEQMKSDYQTRANEIERYEKLRPQKELSLRSLKIDNEQLTSKKELLEAELGK